MSTPAVSVKIQKVTPAKARKWLAQNEVNRNIRRKLVAGYRRDMETGKWTFTAEPIQISETGQLLNGQHRLTALSEAEGVKHIEFVVAEGLPDAAQAMMDQGKSRNVRDALLIKHGQVKNLTLVAAVARMVAVAPEPGPELNPNLLRSKVTTAESMEAFGKYPDIEPACERGSYMRAYIDGSPSGLSYCAWVFNRVDPDAAEEYWKGIVGMEWDYKDDPRRAAVQRMRYLHRTQGIKTSIETTVMLISVLTRTWNAWRKQEEMDSIMARGRSGLILPVRPV